MPSNKSAFTLLFIFLLHQQCTAEVTVSFSIYPPASQQCLNNAAIASGCPLEALTLYDINYCLCGNGGHFIDNTAICLHNSDSLDTQDVWNTMSAACSESDTPIYYSESAFVSIGEGTPASSSPVSSPTSSVPKLPSTPASSPVSTSHNPTPTSSVHSPPAQKAPASSTASQTSPSSSMRPQSSNSNNNTNSGTNVGSLSGGMIALIGTVAGVVSCIIAFLACCVSCGGRNKIEKVVKQTLQQHLRQRPSAEQKSLWANSGYD